MLCYCQHEALYLGGTKLHATQQVEFAQYFQNFFLLILVKAVQQFNP